MNENTDDRRSDGLPKTRPLLQIDGTVTPVEFQRDTGLYYTDLDLDATSGETVEELINELRWKGRNVTRLDAPDDGLVQIWMVFASRIDSLSDSEEVWDFPSLAKAENRMKSLRIQHKHLENWRVQRFSAAYEIWKEANPSRFKRASATH